MTLSEIRLERSRVEKEVASLINDFESKCGVRITAVTLEHVLHLSSVSKTTAIKSILTDVTFKVEI